MGNKISKIGCGFADYELENITKLIKKCKKEKSPLLEIFLFSIFCNYLFTY